MFALRRVAARPIATQVPVARRCFHASATRFVKVGDSIPDVGLTVASNERVVN
jgi:hypothetical protein